MPRAASRGSLDAAEGVKNVIQEQVRHDWSAAETRQIGFDLGNFLGIIDSVEATGEGGFGILNVLKMGTAEDFEAIAQSPRSTSRDEMLWHTGQRMSDSFRRLIIERPANRNMLADARNAVWGSKEPQWWFLEYGNTGMPGAYPMHAGTYSIETIALTSDRDVEIIVERSVNEYLVQKGILV